MINQFVQKYKTTLETFAQNDSEEFSAPYVMHMFVNFVDNQIRNYHVQREINAMIGE